MRNILRNKTKKKKHSQVGLKVVADSEQRAASCITDSVTIGAGNEWGDGRVNGGEDRQQSGEGLEGHCYALREIWIPGQLESAEETLSSLEGFYTCCNKMF